MALDKTAQEMTLIDEPSACSPAACDFIGSGDAWVCAAS
jgi:hypothetical protein